METKNADLSAGTVRTKDVPFLHLAGLFTVFLGVVVFISVFLVRQFPSLLDIDYFRIRQVAFRGLRYVKKEEIINKLKKSGQVYLFSLNTDTLKKQLALPEIERVDLIKRYPHTLIVSITERDPYCLYKDMRGGRKTTIALDRQGVPMGRRAVRDIAFPFVTSRASDPEGPVGRAARVRCLHVLRMFKAYLPHMPLSEVVCPDHLENRIVVYTLLEGYTIIVDDQVKEVQLEQLKRVLQYNRKARRYNYFDVRYEKDVIARRI